MKKVICIHLLNDFSGSPFVLSQVIDIFNKHNFEVDLYTSNSDGFLNNSNAKIYDVFYKRSNNKFITLFFYILSQCILFFKLLKYKNENVVFYINTIMPFGAALAGKIMGKNVIYHIHETSIKPKLLKRFLKFIIKKTSSFNIFVSEYLLKTEYLKNIESKVIYNVLPNTFTEKAEQSKYVYSPDQFIVLMLCSLKAYKGIYEFIKIAKNCEKNNNIQFKLVLNATQNEINEVLLKEKLPSNIKIYSAQKDVELFYKDASLLLNLSRKNEWIETFGMTILEAMSFGIPCIVPNIGGPIELVDHNINGYCIDSNNVDEISNLILKLYNDQKLLYNLSEKARNKSRDFSNINFEKNIIEVIN